MRLAKSSGLFDGAQGPQGEPGKDGTPGRDGTNGKDGTPGTDGYTPVKGVDYCTPVELAELAQSAADIAASGVSSEQAAREAADNALRADITANANADAVTRRSLDALWKLNQGISYQFETDDTEAYQKTVPSGAKLASVEAVGGKTVVWNQLLNVNKYNRISDGVTFDVTNNRVYVTGTALTSGYYWIKSQFSVTIGHRYICFTNSIKGDASAFFVQGKKVNEVFEATEPTINIGYSYKEGVTYDSEFTISLVDLTQIFGSGNEPTSTDDPRIAWIAQYAETHPEYNAGELISAEVEQIGGETVVWNQLLNVNKYNRISDEIISQDSQNSR